MGWCVLCNLASRAQDSRPFLCLGGISYCQLQSWTVLSWEMGNPGRKNSNATLRFDISCSLRLQVQLFFEQKTWHTVCPKERAAIPVGAVKWLWSEMQDVFDYAILDTYLDLFLTVLPPRHIKCVPELSSPWSIYTFGNMWTWGRCWRRTETILRVNQFIQCVAESPSPFRNVQIIVSLTGQDHFGGSLSTYS